jgi:hypothetical protein
MSTTVQSNLSKSVKLSSKYWTFTGAYIIVVWVSPVHVKIRVIIQFVALHNVDFKDLLVDKDFIFESDPVLLSASRSRRTTLSDLFKWKNFVP